MNNASGVPPSRIFPPSTDEYCITGLNPLYHLNVTVMAITPSTRGIEISLPDIYPFGNRKAVAIG